MAYPISCCRHVCPHQPVTWQNIPAPKGNPRTVRLVVLFPPTQTSEVQRYVYVPNGVIVKVCRRCIFHYLWSLQGTYFFHRRSSGNRTSGVPENLKVKLLQIVPPPEMSTFRRGKNKRVLRRAALSLWVIKLLNPSSAFSNAH